MSNAHHPRPWRRDSLYGLGPRRPLSADARRAWLARADLERRDGCLTALHMEVGRALVRRLGTDGRCDPSHATLAEDAGCSERTVRRALGALKERGLLTWEQRIVRCAWPAGGPGATRAEQTSNGYELIMPNTASVPPIRPVQVRRTCGGQAGRETPSRMIPVPLPGFDPAAKKALQEIAAARSLLLAQKWAARRTDRAVR